MTTSLGISKTRDVSDYMKALFRSELSGGEKWVPMPNWPLDFLQDCHYMVRIMVRALRNKSKC